ncbi:MAG: peptidoglycan DD-metalloendopeptidase family protein [bacterium]|nr:peptidoglycan DD-metalloendopeptidase family protein [bacterium]
MSLYLPTTRQFPVTCRWTCSATGGGTYFHSATDYGTPTNSDIVAAASGEIKYLKDGLAPRQLVSDYQYGNHVRIRHPNGYETRYAHLLPNTITVRVGDSVVAGQLLGKSDNTGKSTGPHLHFEVRDSSGRRVNPYGDPPDYRGGCGPGALWASCPPTPAPPPSTDADGDGYTTAQGDCDDRNSAISPSATERCDGRDEDCSGFPDDPWNPQVDEDLAQGIGNHCTVGIGSCARTGEWVCTHDGRATACSADPGTPSTESCNAVDDDCDGETDEPWKSGSTALGQPCTITWDACRVTNGVWVCTPDSRAVVCNAPESSGEEVCDGVDNDCDGQTDNLTSAQLAAAGYCGVCGQQCAWYETCDGASCTCAYEICSGFCKWQECARIHWGCQCSGYNATAYSTCVSDCRAGQSSEYLNEDGRACLCQFGCQRFDPQYETDSCIGSLR